MRDKIEEIVLELVAEINGECEDKFEISEDLILVGENGVLDSMDLVSLIINIEEKLADELDLSITIASDQAFSRKKSPFFNVNSLVDFIIELSEEK